jgi:predicted O-linked N-acetylglucosamine transferase (SPINDLY family)
MSNKLKIQNEFNRAVMAHSAGNFENAKTFYLRVLALEPDHTEALGWLGTIEGQFRNFSAAEALLVKAINKGHKNKEFIVNYANILYETKRFQDALSWYLKVENVCQSDTVYHSNLSACYNEINKPLLALLAAEKSISLNSANAKAWVNKGNALMSLSRHEEALRSYDHATKLDPKCAEGWNNLGKLLHRVNRYEEALVCYSQALELKADYVEALVNFGNSLRGLKRFEEALQYYSGAINVKRDHADAWINQGIAFYELRRLVESLMCYRQAIVVSPDNADTWCNQANVLTDLGRYEEALNCYDHAIRLKPDSAVTFYNRGVLLGEMGLNPDALRSFRRALDLDPGYDFLLGLYIMKRMSLCDWHGLSNELQTLSNSVERKERASFPFATLICFDNPELHYLSAKIYSDARHPKLMDLGEIKRRPKSTKSRIKVGYFSADFREHPIAYLTANLFELHDSERFELFGFSLGPNANSPIRDRIKRSFNQFIDCRETLDVEIARMCRQLEIDIAVDLGGHTQFARTGIFSQRAAPIQVNYLGYPGTMGAEYFDYVIVDKVLASMEDAKTYSEKLVFLPHTYQANDSSSEISTRVFTKCELHLPEVGFVFCCFNNTFKITPEVFDSWMRILRAVDGSVIWLLEGDSLAKVNLVKHAESRGVEGRRLVFAPFMNRSEHLARLRFADLFLDTFPYNAHTTASDALRMGLPVLTIYGRSFAARVAASLLTTVGLAELITYSLDEYEEKAIGLALECDKLSYIKYHLKGSLGSSPLFDCDRFTKGVEAAFERMLMLYLSGRDPEHFYV